MCLHRRYKVSVLFHAQEEPVVFLCSNRHAPGEVITVQKETGVILSVERILSPAPFVILKEASVSDKKSFLKREPEPRKYIKDELSWIDEFEFYDMTGDD